MFRSLRLAVTLVLVTVTAAGDPWRARVVATRVGDVVPSTAAVQARVGERISLTVALLVPGRGALCDHARVRIDDRLVACAGPLPGGARVAWRQVEARREHVDAPSPNAGLTSFSNSVLFGPRHGRWLGYDRLEYTEGAVVPSRDVVPDARSLTVSAARPSDPAHDTHGGAGTAWFSAEVTLADGAVLRAPGAHAADRLGLSTSVTRLSFRSDETFVGWLSTYFHVTSVFGSNGPTAASHQTDRYTGADCADVLVGALRASGRRELAYTSVAGIGAYAQSLTGALRIDAAGLTDTSSAPVALRWGSDVRAGDLVTIDYADDADASLPRAWDHIGALVADDGDGVLSARDTLRHMGGHGLEDSPLVHAGAMRVVLWRWRDARATRRRSGGRGPAAR